MMPEEESKSNYLTTLASNTIYVGYSLPQSYHQIGRCIERITAQVGSAANPATLDQAYQLTQKEYKNKTVVIVFAAGVHGRANQKYAWTPHVDFLGQGSSNTTVLGNHSWINRSDFTTLTTQITGLTFKGGNDESFPTLHVEQQGGGKSHWKWQQDGVNVRSESGPLLDIKNNSDSLLECINKNSDFTNTVAATDFLIRVENSGNGRTNYSVNTCTINFKTLQGNSAVQYLVSSGVLETFIESLNARNVGDGDLTLGLASQTGTLKQNYNKDTVLSNEGSGIVHKSIISDSALFNLSVNSLLSKSTLGKSVERVYKDNAVVVEEFFNDNHMNTTAISQPLITRLVQGSADVTSTINNSSTKGHTDSGIPLIRNHVIENGSFNIKIGNYTLSNMADGDGVLDQSSDDSVMNILRFNYIGSASNGTVLNHKLDENSTQDSLLQAGLIQGKVGYNVDNKGNSFNGSVSSTKMSAAQTDTVSVNVDASVGNNTDITLTGSQVQNIKAGIDPRTARIPKTSSILVSGCSVTSSSLTPAVSSTGGNIKFAASNIVNNGGGPAIFADRSSVSVSSSRILHGDTTEAITSLVQLLNAQCAIASSEISTSNRFIDADDQSRTVISSIISKIEGDIQAGGVIAYSGNSSFIDSNKIRNATVQKIENTFDPN